MPNPFLPLKNIHILDFSRLFPGPFLTKIFLDWGAKVTRVELKDRPDEIEAIPLMSRALNDGKAKWIFDPEDKKDTLKLNHLLTQSDILLESFRPGVLEAYKLDAKTILKKNPKLIYASLTGYGQTGPDAHRAGHDINFLCASGMISELVANDTLPKFHLADFVGGGLFGATKILAALLETKVTGKGRHVDISMTDSLVALNQHQTLFDKRPNLGMITGELARYHLYKTKDGVWIGLGAFEDKFWQRFCDAILRPEWKTSPANQKEEEQRKSLLKKLFADKPASHWRKIAETTDCCLSVAATREDLVRKGYLVPLKGLYVPRTF